MAFEITREGESETAKALIHMALGGLAVTCAAYNAVALVARPSKHLALNTAIYSAVAALECYQVLRHLRKDA